MLHRRLGREGKGKVVTKVQMENGGRTGGNKRIPPVDVVEDVEGMPPGVGELGVGELGIHATPPRCAEEAVVEGPDIGGRSQPVPVDSLGEGCDGVGDGEVGNGEVRDGALVSLAAGMPDAADDGDAKAGPKLVELQVVAGAVDSPLSDVIS
jgi:hypothetical protein